MKWKAIILLFLLLFLISKGVWIIALPILSYLLYSSIASIRSLQSGARRIISITPILFIFLGILAFIEHGYFSPFLFIIIGTLLLFRREITQLIKRNVRSIEDSILLRNRLIPFHWLCIMEIKSTSLDPYPISNIDGKVILTMSKEKGIFIILNSFSLGKRSAEEKIIRKASELAAILRRSFTYILPLDSKDSERLVKRRGCKGRVEGIDKLRYADYDSLSIEISNGLINGLSIYKDSKGNCDAYFLAEPSKLKERKPFIHELLSMIKERYEVRGLDDYTAFLSTIAISKGEPFGRRIKDIAQSDNRDGMLMVECITGQTVSLSRAQLRAIIKMY